MQRGRTAVKSLRRDCFCGLLLLAIDNSACMDNWGKEIFDMLHHMRVTPDDKYLYLFATSRDADTKAGTCGIVVWSLPKAVRYAA